LRGSGMSSAYLMAVKTWPPDVCSVRMPVRLFVSGSLSDCAASCGSCKKCRMP
jgi:hypothetical protein